MLKDEDFKRKVCHKLKTVRTYLRVNVYFLNLKFQFESLLVIERSRHVTKQLEIKTVNENFFLLVIAHLASVLEY